MMFMEAINKQPLVSVPVITYNSAKYVLETLESIKAQTYKNIELIISDDCSIDDTVELCQKWVEQNKERFVHTQIITSETNTGISANLNRAEAACQGEWVKGIAGDDLLMPNCVENCVRYIDNNQDVVYLFSRMEAFGASSEECQKWDALFNYDLFSLTSEQLLYHLIFCGNGIPAPALFYKRTVSNVKNDERIPLLEDWPKWINLVKNGEKFYFIDKVLVKYRLVGISTRGRSSLRYYQSERLFRFYYLYPEWKKVDGDAAINKIVDEECDVYKMLIETESEEQTKIHSERNMYKDLYLRYLRQYNQVMNSKAYKLGKFFIRPFHFVKNIQKMLFVHK